MNTFTEQPGLLDKIANGDQEGMRQLIDNYSGLVWSLVRRKIANAVDAEDLVQEIFSDIWKSAHRYNMDMGSEATFIGVITRRRVIDAIRKKTKHAAPVSFDGIVEFSTESNDTSGKCDADISSVLQVLHSLKPQRRRVLELSIVRGLSHAQIVEATDIPLGTVKAHIRRGLGEIRTLLQVNHSTGEAPQ